MLDDLEQVREMTDRIVLIDVLHRLSQNMLVIVNSVNPPPEEIYDNMMVIPLFTERNHYEPRRTGLRDTRLGKLSRKWVISEQSQLPTSTNSQGATYTDASKVASSSSAEAITAADIAGAAAAVLRTESAKESGEKDQ